MVKSSQKWLDVFVAGLVLLSYMALRTTFPYSGLSLVIPITGILMMPVGGWLDERYPLYRKATTLITLLFVTGLFVFALRLMPIHTAIMLFGFIQFYSLIHRRSVMSYHHIMLMSFFMLVATLVMSPSASLGIILFGYVVMSAGCLALLDRHKQVQAAREIHAESGWLHSGSGAPIRRSRSMMIPMFVIIGVGLMGLMVSVFALLPRTEMGVLGAAINAPIYTSGLSDDVKLNFLDSISGDSGAVMQVKFLEMPGGKFDRALFWRSTSMDKYNGTGWTRQGLTTFENNQEPRLRGFKTVHPRMRTRVGRGVLQRSRLPGGKGEWVRYEIFVDRYPEGGFPLLSTVLHLQPKDDTRRVWPYFARGGDFTVNIGYRDQMTPYLTGISEYLDPDPAELRASSVDYLNIMLPSDFRLLTEHNLEERTLQLTDLITRGAETSYDKVVQIETFLTGPDYVYSKVLPLLDPLHPIDDFINDVQLGHCELFASAMALMVRSEGIPARVVSGYRGGEWDESTESYTVTKAMAHLWVEVFFPDVGWVTFDPAPTVSEMDQSVFDRVQLAIAGYSIRMRIYWLRYVVGYSPNGMFVFLKDRSLGLVQNIFQINDEVSSVESNVTVSDRIKGLAVLLCMVLVVAIMLYTIYRLFAGERKRGRVALSGGQANARRLYSELLRKLERQGVECRNRSAEEVLARLRLIGHPGCLEIEEFVECYHDARFGPRGMSVDDVAHFRRMIRGLAAAGSVAD
jgi:hypothetical protein